MTLSFKVAALALCASALAAQTGASGHFEGGIDLPDRQLKIEVDLDRTDKGEWAGTISIPEQRLKNVPLGGVSVQGNAVSFVMKGIPGEPTFKGTLMPETQTIAGDFTQASAQLTFFVKRTGAAILDIPKSTPITNAMAGTWDAALEVAPDKKLRLTLKLANTSSGAAAGTMVSIDQGNLEIPITAIVQTGPNLKLEVRNVNGSYTGDLAGNTISGQWTQHGSTFPLVFTRAAK